MRTPLTQARTFYVATSGSDSTGDGSLANPWATPLGAYNRIKADYDLCGFQATISIGPGDFTSSVQCKGSIVGQSGMVHIQGSGQTTKIKPTSGYCVSASDGADIQISEMWLDSCANNANNDTLSIGNGSHIDIWTGIVFGNNIDQYNDISVNGYLTVSADYIIFKSVVQTTGSWSSGSNTIQVASATGLRKYMGVAGPNIPAGAFITSMSGNALALDYVKGAPFRQTGGSGSGTPLSFSYGGQCHVDIGNMGRVYYDTNNDPAHAKKVEVYGNPMYLAGFVYASGLSMGNMSQINFVPQFNGANCVPFDISENSVLYTGGRLWNYFPGYVANADGSYGLIASGARYS